MRSVTEALVSGVFRNLRDGGTAILIETLRTDTDAPRPPTEQLAEFYDILQTEYGFLPRSIRTDFSFDTIKTAVRLLFRRWNEL